MKKCPYCAEDIQEEATHCRFCNKSLKSFSLFRAPRKVLILLGCSLVFFGFVVAIFCSGRKGYLEDRSLFIESCSNIDLLFGLYIKSGSITFGDMKKEAESCSEELKKTKVRLLQKFKRAKKVDKVVSESLLPMVNSAIALADSMINDIQINVNILAAQDRITQKKNAIPQLEGIDGDMSKPYVSELRNQISDIEAEIESNYDAEGIVKERMAATSKDLLNYLTNLDPYLNKYRLDFITLFPNLTSYFKTRAQKTADSTSAPTR